MYIMNLLRSKIFVVVALTVFFFVFSGVSAADTVGQSVIFNVNSSYDKFSRTNLSATLRQISEHAYFYVEDSYWNNLNSNEKNYLNSNLSVLAQEFDNNIYPKETQFWGSEPNPGIDNDPKITIVLEDLVFGNGGYFDTSNEYPKNISRNSNEREIIFINVKAGNFAKMFLGHELQHLISFNQKEILRKTQEDVWLNELRSEYSVTLLGYNDNFNTSNLERRARTFLDNPSDSLTEWPNVSTDYAQVTLFGQYLLEQYGQSIFRETLQSSTVGIDSINQFLQSRSYPEKFSNVFENWTVANYLNDTVEDKRYGYQREELKNIHVIPQQSFLSYPSLYVFNYDLKSWQSAWYKYNFYSLPSDKAVKISYSPNYLVKVLYADNLGRVGVLNNLGYITNPGGLSSVVLMPISEIETSNFDNEETPRTISVSINYIDNELAKPITDGALIKRPRESEIYVVEGKYKRYLRPEIIKLYGHLDASKVIELDDKIFNSYSTANYVRNFNDKKVYAVWPDGTKHWLNMTGDYFTQSGRDWGAIFTINDLEFNSYKTGTDITK
ncbi:MAG: hypothetical protein A2649_00900 [Candidatus Yanofskybacteria bacterium RIFCSPHIGHO2_01_FULL_41_26]|uniref:Uncharacterized protein n=1 Tax=Candidatus Yanofskybacteria bacterium RIFCSPHIGHO2_01_FULL_41_26 TaxID=1802661 RepID=A0A1F8EFT1_9BACT|nr:MAG: hypothetical protein A2649_00900 [Candidatus Yanofskybacteria bacterium RIFCSPHIGHO2_01_FULL_41_26]